MRIIVDTNVFISACIGKGAASEVIRACIQDHAFPVMGASLFLEYEDYLFSAPRLNKAARYLLLDVFIAKCFWSDVYFKWRPNLRDEADNHLIELAIAGQAQWIVTGNTRDFRDADLRFDQFSAVTPGRFLQELSK